MMLDVSVKRMLKADPPTTPPCGNRSRTRGALAASFKPQAVGCPLGRRGEHLDEVGKVLSISPRFIDSAEDRDVGDPCVCQVEDEPSQLVDCAR